MSGERTYTCQTTRVTHNPISTLGKKSSANGLNDEAKTSRRGKRVQNKWIGNPLAIDATLARGKVLESWRR